LIASLLQRQGVRQLIKFCIVGFSSMIVDKGLLWLLSVRFMLLERLPYIPWWSWATLTFCAAVTNGFIWNQRWTFRAHAHGKTNSQYIKFIATNCVGLLLNLLITKMFLMYFTGTVVHEQNPDARLLLISSICAIPFVVVWNFSAAKYWTFRAPKPLAESLNATPPSAPSDDTTLLA
jgi:putative flippase GtrA